MRRFRLGAVIEGDLSLLSFEFDGMYCFTY